MMIRSYTADSVASALKQVRTEMGGDAVVLKTRVVPGAAGEKLYEVTACLDQPTVEQANRVLESKPAATATVVETPTAGRVDLSDVANAVVDPTAGVSDAVGSLSAIEAKLDSLLQASQLQGIGLTTDDGPLAQAVSALREADVPAQWLTAFIESIRSDQTLTKPDADAIHRQLVEHLESTIDTGVEFKPGDRVLVVGPAGSGKTSIIGRLAAWLTHEKKTAVKLVSLDNYKVGAIDEIASYADLLDVGEIVTMDGSDIEPVPQDNDKVILIDTGALPSDRERLTQLEAKVQQLNPTHRLAVFSALTRTSDVETCARQMAWLNLTHLVFTMTDLTDRLGAMVAATTATGVKIAMVTDSPSGADAFQAPNADAIATAILGQEAVRE